MERELDEELRYHLDHLVDDYIVVRVAFSATSAGSAAARRRRLRDIAAAFPVRSGIAST